MYSKRLIVLAAIGLLTFAANAAQIIIPAAGAGAGANGSNWQSDVLLHNAAPRPITVTASLHHGTQITGSQEITLQAKQTLAIRDVARTLQLPAGTGAVVIELAERDTKYLAVTSRTFNASNAAEFGQDIPAVNAADAATAGDIAVLTNPDANAATSRFNFGVYAVEPAVVSWELLRADGTVVSEREISYAAGEHQQYNGGIVLDVQQAADSVYARIVSGKAVVYGSTINKTGDPTFVPGNIVREDVTVSFGVDLDEDGTIDITDADGDGVLDEPVTVYTSLYPAYFRIIAESEFGGPVTLEVVQSEADAVFRDANGTMRVGAAGDLKNKSGSIVVRATSGTTEALLTIPVRFR